MSTEEPGPGLEGPGGAWSRLRTIGTRSAIRSGEGSFRGLLSGLSKTAERSGNGPSYREMGTAYYLREEMHSARQAVKQLDAAVSAAQSFREAASKLREEAHRAMARLERAVAQVMNSEYVDPDLIGIACDITCAAKRGITLVDVYGKYSTMVKVMTIFLRSYIHSKFEKQTELLKKLNPSVQVQASAHRPQVPLPPVPAAQSQQHTSSTASVQSNTSANTVGGAPLSVIPEVVTQLGRSSAGTAAPSQAAAPPAVPQSLAVAPPTPQPPAATQPLVGKMLQCNRHEKVLAMTYVPAAQVQASEYMCIWWSVGQRMEFYSEATQSTTVFQEASNVTALGIDEAGSVWTGHAKGQVRVRYKQQWERTMEDKVFTTAVRAIAFDDLGRAWAGDESGRIKVMAYDPQGGQLATVAALQRSPTFGPKTKVASGNLFSKRHCNSGTSGQASAAAVFAAATATAVTVANSVAAAAVAAATTATGRENSPGGATIAGATAVAAATTTSAGGNNGPSVHNHTPPGTMEGPVRCIFVRGSRAWASGGRSYPWLQLWDTDTLQDLDLFECGTLGPCHAMAPLRWPSASSAGPSLHITIGSQHHRTHSDGCRGTQVPPTSGAGGHPGSSWRLLTGHENGQLLLWHPGHRNLAPLLRIGDPGSPCRGIAAFEGFNLVVTGHQGGQLHLFRQPTTESALPPGADSASPQSLGTHRPKMVVVTAHKSRLDRMTCNATSCVTASILGTIRLWHAADLAAEAQRLGLVFTQHTASYGSLQGELAQTGMLYASSTSSQFVRDTAKCVASDFPQHASGQLASPVLAVGAGSSQGTAQLTAAASAMSSIPSATLLRPASGGTNASVTGGASHLRQSSKDSMDTVCGTQPNSATTVGTGQSTDAMGTLSHNGPGPTGASCQHFQTIDYSELQMQRKIGSGAYGEVLLADWTGSEVAVKKLFAVQNMNDKEYSSLVNEVSLLGSLNHPNIARFLAMCEEPPCIVMQYYPYGSLFDLLSRAQKGSPKAAKELTWSKRLDMLRDVASGMQYLHSRKPPVIHGDLRSPNLLLDLTIDRERPRFHVRIADFGLARMANGVTGSVMVSKMTNPRWLAPEVIRNSAVGKAADVYSFSIIMWEMLTWKQPYQDMMSVQVMFSTVTENSRPEVPPDAELPGAPGTSLPLYIQLMERCWQADAGLRPSFKDVVEVLQNMQKVETDSPRPQRPQQQPQAAGPVQTPQQPQQQHSGRGTGGSKDVSGYVPSPFAAGGNGDGNGAATTTGIDTARESTSAPTTSGNGMPSAAAAVAAAARRTISTGVTSPFMCPTALTAPGELQADNGGGGIPLDGSQGSHGAKQYSSMLPPFGMSPILEETGSATPSISQQSTERPAAAIIAAGVSAVLAVGCVATATCASATPPVQQQHNASHLHQHVHFPATSPFSQQAPGDASSSVPASVSCPGSPTLQAATAATSSASVKGLAGPGPNPLSSASSAESGIVHDVSDGSNIAGMPITADSSRQSSTSTSGRAIGAAVAVVTTNAALVPAAPVACRKTDAAPAATIAAGQGVSGLILNLRDGGSEVAIRPGVSRKGPSMVPSNAGGHVPRLVDTGGGAAEMPLWPAYSTPTVAANSITSLSPFASIPAAQLGELDAAAPQLAALPGEHLLGAAATAAVAASHMRAAAPPSPRNAVIPRVSHVIAGGSAPQVGAGARGASAAGRSGHHANGVQAMPACGRGRTFIGHGVPPRTGGTIGGGGPTSSGTPRSGGSGSSSQPGTPPHAGQAAASPVRRGTVGHGSRQGSTTGLHSTTTIVVPTPGFPGRSHSGDGPSGDGGRRRIGSTSGDAAVPQAVAVSAQLSLLAGRLSHSAAHTHVDGHDDHAMGNSDCPGHRRTPSGGSIGNPAVGRGRELGPLVHEGPAGLHPRTPTRGSNYLASPRAPIPSTSSSIGEPRPMPGARRNHHVMPPSAGISAAYDVIGSPSAPSSGHMSRLAAAARPPGSPRSHIPGGPGPAAPHLAVSTSATSAVSRIPSLIQTANHGSGQTETTKSSTYRSLDDLRRLDLCQEVISSPPMGSAVGSPTVVSRATAPPVADSAWEEGLDSVRRSPEVTQEVPLDRDDSTGRATISVMQQTGPEATGEEPYTSLRRVVLSEQPAARTGTAEAAAQQPASLLVANAPDGRSPFAAAAYAGAVFGTDEAAKVLHKTAEACFVGSVAGVLDNRTSPGVAMNSTSPIVQSSPLAKEPLVNDPSTVPAGAASSATVVTVLAAPIRVTATAQKSPFAQAPEQDSWWEDQYHDD
ncbi:hypothetical protein VaNZ11_004517 [Volvox africanus]|uniref:Protein kinase domain-containing protein n=1 Tax=Volvox africanus TaxID=51714 RepID=A0ABQ5RXP1_9CHLO|nr:hypothetical protein VaNZ11_004517 [Volvox africanus]